MIAFINHTEYEVAPDCDEKQKNIDRKISWLVLSEIFPNFSHYFFL